ncbi:hypothetical protein B296_00023378 [Ensete ventricosum]|uniref:Uncharacterized protein n=1 Tax=Ensete ventricosum TaxID=4639 RepID=A0A427A280_ENSVE|nr:hypothetical protein B296_00023378 [Ensete ventricosum]
MPLRGVEGNDRAFYGATLVGMDNKPCRCLKPYPGLPGRPELYEPPRIMQDDIKPHGSLWIALVSIASRMPPGITRDDARRTRGATRDMEPSRTPDGSWSARARTSSREQKRVITVYPKVVRQATTQLDQVLTHEDDLAHLDRIKPC